MRTMLTMPNIIYINISNTPEISLCFAHFGLYEISTPVMRTIPIIVNFV